MLRVREKRRIIIAHPKGLMKFLAMFVQFLPQPLRFLTPGGVDFVTMEEIVDNGALKKVLDFPLTDLDAGLRKYLAPSARRSIFAPESRLL